MFVIDQSQNTLHFNIVLSQPFEPIAALLQLQVCDLLKANGHDTCLVCISK